MAPKRTLSMVEDEDKQVALGRSSTFDSTTKPLQPTDPNTINSIGDKAPKQSKGQAKKPRQAKTSKPKGKDAPNTGFNFDSFRAYDAGLKSKEAEKSTSSLGNGTIGATEDSQQLPDTQLDLSAATPPLAASSVNDTAPSVRKSPLRTRRPTAKKLNSDEQPGTPNLTRKRCSKELPISHNGDTQAILEESRPKIRPAVKRTAKSKQQSEEPATQQRQNNGLSPEDQDVAEALLALRAESCVDPEEKTLPKEPTPKKKPKKVPAKKSKTPERPFNQRPTAEDIRRWNNQPFIQPPTLWDEHNAELAEYHHRRADYWGGIMTGLHTMSRENPQLEAV